MSRVLIPLAKGFEDIEFVSVVDVLRRGGVEVVTASIGDGLSVESAHGVSMCADAMFADVSGEGFDAIVLPGGGEGTRLLRESEDVKERLRVQKEAGGLICAICAAPLVLVDAGVLEEDQHVTCYPTCSIDLDRPCSGVPVVADGNVITGQAPGSAMLFGLVVLGALAGDEVRNRVARGLVTDVI